ncbi:MAG: PepSY-associated TM helix domain-containing protein [Robiginitomaculum sp.]
MQKPRAKNGILLFLPAFMNRTHIIRWLKRIHAWTGFWGALTFLLLGVSGFLLNHRSILKIETGRPQEVMSITLNIDPTIITSPETLGAWAQKEFGTNIKPRAPRSRGSQPANIQKPDSKRDENKTPNNGSKRFMNRDVKPAIIWMQAFNAPNSILTVEYSPGSTIIKASKKAKNGWILIKNLHKGSGLGIVWVLFLDLMAGALIAMSLTGALLWSRLHGSRLIGIGIVLASVGLGLFAALPNFL